MNVCLSVLLSDSLTSLLTAHLFFRRQKDAVLASGHRWPTALLEQATPDFWQVLAHYRDCLRPFKSMVDWAQGESIGRIAELQYRLQNLRTMLEAKVGVGGVVALLAEDLLASINSRFGASVFDLRNMPLAAAALDTRFAHTLSEAHRAKA